MVIEMWKDAEGYRLQFEDNQFDLSADALEKMVGWIASSSDMMDVGDYRQIILDLPEAE